MSMRSLMASAAGGMVLALSAGLNPLQAQGSQTEQCSSTRSLPRTSWRFAWARLRSRGRRTHR